MNRALRDAAQQFVIRRSFRSFPVGKRSSGTAASTANNMASISWNRITPSGSKTPLPRSSHGLSALDDGRRLVVYGGENIARTPITEEGQVLWLAEKRESDEWKWISLTATDGVSPPSRVAHSQASVGDTVYIFGGRQGIGMAETPLSDLWKMEISGDTVKWAELTPVGDEAPEARSFHKMIAIETDLYMFGGCGAGGRMNDLWKFDTVGKMWVSLGSSHVLRGRGGPNILCLSGGDKADNVKIAIVAGFAGEETNDGHIFINNSWEAKGMNGLAEMRKRSVCCFGSLLEQNKCIIFGGEVDPSNKGHEGAGGFEKDLVLLDRSSGALVEVMKPKEGETWPGARGWADAAVSGNTFYVFGGLAGDDTSPVRLDDMWECKVSS
ncbi:hypothetical protein ACHAWF_003645 [Thalassiosira exigua]